MNKDQFAYLNMENNDLRAELERLKGKTGCCMQCEQYAKELGLVKAELRNSNKGAEINAKVNAMFATRLRETAKKYSALLHRLEAAERYIELCPSDPDIYPEQFKAWKAWIAAKGIEK